MNQMMMISAKNRIIFFGVLFSGMLISAGHLFAYDKYAPVYSKPLKSSSLKDPLSTLLALPFEMIRWPVSKSLLLVEKKALPKKIEWAYSYLKNHGIEPSVGYMSGEGMQGGLKLDLPRLSGLQSKYPDLIFDAWTYYGNEVYFKAGTEVGVERIAETPVSATAFFEYQNRREEDFYGIGPDASRGNGVSYEEESTTVAGKIGYEFSHSLKSFVRMTYQNTNIGNGEDEHKGQLDYFGRQNIPGGHGDKTLAWDLGLNHDTRDFSDAPTEGGYRKLGFGYTEGLQESNASYLTYSADAAQYFKIGSKRRIFAIRGVVEHQDEINGGNIPFYRMSKLGGYGTTPEKSHALRSYAVNRFTDESLMLFNFEYRYAIWEYREMHMDAVPFFDFGQVFGEWSDMQFKDFKESYGLEFRVYVARVNLLNLSIAHGDEGTNFFVRSKKAF